MPNKINATEFLSQDQTPKKQKAEDFLSGVEEPQQTQQKQQTLAEGFDTPDFLKAENIPSGKELRDTLAAVPEVADKVVTSMVAGSAALPAKMTGTTYGTVTGKSPEEAIQTGKQWGQATNRFINLMLHPGADVEDLKPSEEAEPSVKALQAAFETPKKYLFEPAGDLYEKVTGSKIGGSLTTDAMDVLFWSLAPLKLKKFSGKAVRKMRARKARMKADEAMMEQTLKSAEDLKKAQDKLGRSAERFRQELEQTRKSERAGEKTARSQRQEEVEAAFKDQEAIEQRGVQARRKGEEKIAEEQREADTYLQKEEFDTAAEQQKRLEDAEEIRQRELEARQKLYEDFFNEESVSEYMDDVENFIDRKAKGGAPKVTREEIEILYNNWLERQKNKNLEFKKDWENWQKEKARLDSEGIKPAADLYRTLQFEIGPKGKGLPPGMSELQFGVETQRPYPQIGIGDSLIESPRPEYTLQKDKLGYKRDYSIREKMELTGEKKVPTKEQFDEIAAPETDTATAQGTAIAQMGEQIFRDLEGQGMEPRPEDFAQPQRGEAVEPIEYTPPKTAEDAFISSQKLEAREQMIRQIYERKKTEVETRTEAETSELEALKREQQKDMEETVEESLMPEDPEARAARDMDEFLTETEWEPSGRTPFEESLDMEDSRPLDEMLEDWKTVIADDWKSQRGSISFEKLDQKQMDAIRRLEKDIQVIKRNAAKVGKKISQYLLDAGFVTDPKIAQYIEENADRVVPSTSTKHTVSAEGGNARAVTKMFERAREAQKRGPKTWTEKIGDIGAKIWAVDAKVRKYLEKDPSWEARKVLENKINTKGASARAQEYFNKASEQIFGHLTGREREALDLLVNARNKLDIAKRYGPNSRHLPEKGLKTQDYAAFVNNFKKEMGLSDASYNKVKQAGDDYFNTMRDLLAKKYQAGAIPDWLYEMLKDNEYSPIQYQQYLDTTQALADSEGSMDIRQTPKDLDDYQKLAQERMGSNDFNKRTTEIRKLAGGKRGYENLNSEQLLSSVVFNSMDWIMKNETTKSLGRYADNVPNEAVIPGKVRKTKTDNYGNIHKYYEDPPEGYKALHYFENGDKKTIYTQDWFAEQWRNSNKEVRHDLAGTLRFLSMSPVLREMATGAGNPFFGLFKGLPMDLLTIYMNAQKRRADGSYTSVYSYHIPKYIPQITADIARVAPDVLMKKGRYLDAIEDGLSMNWLAEGAGPSGGAPNVSRGMVGKASKGLKGVHDYLTFLNKNTELITRHAVRERMLREGYSREAATSAARDYLDYSQGGSSIKAVDNVLPYFNVSVQAARTTMRSAKRNPKEFAIKAGELMALASSIDAIARATDEEAKKAESDYNKDNYFILPTGMSFKDDFGNKQKLNLKIRKEPSLTPLFTAAELINSAAFGDEVEFERLGKSFSHAAPRIGPSNLPPSTSAAATYAWNIVPFTGREAWKGPDVKAEKQWDPEQSSRMWKDIGEAIGASPAKLKASFEQVATHGNLFAGLMGRSYDHLVGKLETQDQEFLAADFAAENFGSEFLSVVPETQVNWEYLDEVDKKESGKRFGNNQKLDRLAKEYYLKESIEYDKLQDAIIHNKDGSVRDPDERERLRDRLQNFVYLQNTNFKNFWQGAGAANNPEAKARMINRKLMESDENTKNQLEEDLYYLQMSPSRIIPKTVKSDFWQEFYKIRGEKTWED